MDQCNKCSAPSEFSYCDQCHMETIAGILGSPDWLRWRGVSAGDIPGETLADSLRRELVEIRERITCAYRTAQAAEVAQ